MPRLGPVGWVIVIYAVALLTVPLLLRRHRLEWTWILIIPIGVVLGAIVVGQGRSAREAVGSRATQINIARLPSGELQRPRPLATVEGYVALHSKSDQTLDFSANDPQVLVGPLSVLRTGLDLSLSDLHVSMNYRLNPVKVDGGKVTYLQMFGQQELSGPRPAVFIRDTYAWRRESHSPPYSTSTA